MSSDILVSIVVPVYNAASYIEQCVRSIIGLQCRSWELILVDDGSKDNSLTICRELASGDSRISVVSKANGGPSSARNVGLELARGEWVCFVDADDWVGSDFLSPIIEAPDVDMIYFGYVAVESGGKETLLPISPKSYRADDRMDAALRDLLQSKELFFGFTWNKFFRRSIIEKVHLRFDEKLYIKEDEEFIVRYCRHIRSLYISNAAPYYYRLLPTSLSHGGLKYCNMGELALTLLDDLKDYPHAQFKAGLINRIYSYWGRGVREARTMREYMTTIVSWDRMFQQNKNIMQVGGMFPKLFRIPCAVIRVPILLLSAIKLR